MLRSAVGKTHVLRSGLVINYATSYFTLIVFGIPFGFQIIILCCVQVPVISRQPIFCEFPPTKIRTSSSYLLVYTGCALVFVLQVRSLYVPLTNGPHFRARFGESPVVRLYSQIDNLHLSIEAQCISHLLPFGDCHIINM